MKKTVWLAWDDETSPRLVPLEGGTGERLTDVLIRGGFFPKSDCGGKGWCKKCTVEVATLSTAMSSAHFSDANPSLASLGEHLLFAPQLACQTVLADDMVVRGVSDYRAASMGHEQILTDDVAKTVSVERLPQSLSQKTKKNRFGIAVDLGTTTIAVALVDLDSGGTAARAAAKNPQTVFGADVISRIERAASGAEAQSQLAHTVRDEINRLIASVVAEIGANRAAIERVVVAGNSVMEYLFLGLDPAPIGRSPFVPPCFDFSDRSAAELGLDLSPTVPVTLMPILTGFIGGDLVAGMIALDERRRRGWFSGPELLIDIGTNGEMLLFHGGRILATSTAAGPVFEGAHIRFGSFAGPGAIEGVDFSPVPYWENPLFAKITENTRPYPYIKTIGDLPPTGICGSGLVDTMAELLRLELVAPNGRLLDATNGFGKKEKGRLGTLENQRAFLLTSQAGLAPPIWITQNDIRQVQLAVGAVRAGLLVLLERAKLSVRHLRKIYVAGGFGNYLRKENAQRIGLLPPNIPSDRIVYCGNTSLAGATVLLKKPSILRAAQQVRRRTEHLELAANPDFRNLFAESMIFPGIDS